MTPFISPHLDEHKIIADDNKARALAQHFGVIDHLIHSPDPSDHWLNIVAYPEHKTHYLLFLLYSGFQNAADNGYVVHYLPKTKFTLSDAEQYVKQILLGCCTVEDANEATVTWLPSQKPDMN